MKREVSDDERAIRSGIVDILCFLSMQNPTEAQVAAIRGKLEEALEVFQGNPEQVKA